MNIYFVGQISVLGTSAQEKRVVQLADSLASQGHAVHICSATHKQLRRLNNFTVRYVPSLLPEKPGGWFYTTLSILKAVRGKASVIHLSGWKAATLGPIAAIISPHTTLVWTVDSLPLRNTACRRFIVWLARLYDAVITPTRNLQYQFRLMFGTLPTYIPDGYTAPALQDIPASHWNLRKNQYIAVICDDASTLNIVAKSYKQAKTRKKLVVVTNKATSQLRRIAKKHPLLQLIEATTPRQRTSLVRQAKAVVLPDTTVTQEELLLAMDAGKTVLATSHPLLQEIAGTTAQFFQLEDSSHITDLLETAAKQKNANNLRAQKRARAHFTWNRVFSEYETFYHYPVVRKVAIDSVGTNRIITPVPQN